MKDDYVEIVRFFFKSKKWESSAQYFVYVDGKYRKLRINEDNCFHLSTMNILDSLVLQTYDAKYKNFEIIKDYGKIKLI